MAKKESRAQQVSKGVTHQKPCPWRKIKRKEWNGSSAQVQAKMKAFLAGKNVMLTIENPNKNETNKKFIRVNAKEVWRNS